MSSALLDLFRLILAKGAALELDLVEKRHERLKEIESGNIFNNYAEVMPKL